MTYTDPAGRTVEQGFKLSHMDWLRRRDPRIVYVGDGFSDLEAARGAGHVFATGHLAGLLRRERVPWSLFDSFIEVAEKLATLDLPRG